MGDFIERLQAMKAIAIVVGDISVRFPDVMTARSRAPGLSQREIQEHSA